jgi:hypothetical protein
MMTLNNIDEQPTIFIKRSLQAEPFFPDWFIEENELFDKLEQEWWDNNKHLFEDDSM